MQQTHYIIDGYSLLHVKHPGQLGSKVQLDHHREALIREIDQWRRKADYVTLVFDGRQFSRAAQSRTEHFHIVYTNKNQSADAYIERLCHELPKPETSTVVSNDRAIIELTAASGCFTRSCNMFLYDLEGQSRTLARKRVQINQQIKRPTLGDFFPDSPK
ncbi:MAG: ribosomal protection tetracycline resistance protein [Kiritimatiellia bacterium]|jgi:uncharacterized protein